MIQPYYKDEFYTQYAMDCEVGMKELPDNSVDLVCTDPPYGYSFMGKDWDKAVPKVEIWKECLRLLKPGAFAFVMSAPRQDVLSRMIVNLQDAGFDMGFTSIYWTYASGFPKAENIGKMVDKQLGYEREVIGHKNYTSQDIRNNSYDSDRAKDRGRLEVAITQPTSEQAKALDGSYGGFQPKPAVEIIIVAMKPLSKKTFVAQALDNFKGITWLDDCRIPTDGRPHIIGDYKKTQNNSYTGRMDGSLQGGSKLDGETKLGRFPANLLVSDDVLNDGKKWEGKVGFSAVASSIYGNQMDKTTFSSGKSEYGSFSRYFDLDKWWSERIKSLPQQVQEVYPFLICPKASKSEKNVGCEELEETIGGGMQGTQDQSLLTGSGNIRNNKAKNSHPTVKPLKLMSYLVTLGSRPGDVVLDNFIGSGTTARACKMLNRKCIGFEIDVEQYSEIAKHRQNKVQMGLL